MTNKKINDFFTPLKNTKPFLKATFEGEAGSGKTYTSTLLTIGLHKRIESKKPVIIFDTENSSKFLKKMFDEASIEVLVKQSSTLADLKITMEAMKEGMADILFIDSLSHVWEDLVQSFQQKYNRTRLQIQDWGVIKPLWKKEVSEQIINAPYHMIMCGRVKDVWANEINEETGKREMFTTGEVKMRAEGETEYESDLVVLMERIQENAGLKNKLEIYRQAKVLKDRSTILDGQIIKNPTYESFSPVVEEMLTNAESPINSPKTDTTGLFRTEEDRYEYKKQKEVLLEEIEGELVRAWPSTGASDKAAKLDAIENAFTTRSWTAITEMSLETLKEGLIKIAGIVSDELVKRYPETDTKKVNNKNKKNEDTKTE